VETSRQQVWDAEQKAEAEVAIRKAECKFRALPQVAQWAMQYAKVESRYQFLVLDGKSRTGKTRFEYSLLDMYPRSALDNPGSINGLSPPPGPRSVFYADCSGGLPDLRKFRRGVHVLIVLDEMGPDKAIQLKKVMQASNDDALLGASPTMQHAYTVNSHRTMIVVTTNVWAVGLKTLHEEHRDWLFHNSIVVHIDAPMWVVS